MNLATVVMHVKMRFTCKVNTILPVITYLNEEICCSVGEQTPKHDCLDRLMMFQWRGGTLQLALVSLDKDWTNSPFFRGVMEAQTKENLECSGPSSYDRLDIRTTWVTTKILVLTYDQHLELRPAWRS
jgi:hypothetical protein